MATYEQQESYACSHSGGVGGADVAAIVGLSPWRTPIEVWESKVFPERVPELDKECLWFGSALEPVIRERYSMRNQVEVVSPSELGKYFPRSRSWNNQTIVIGDEPWILGSADGWMPSVEHGLEVKNVGHKTEEWGEFGTDEIPAQYVCQCHWYIPIHHAKGWNVAPLFSGNTLGNYHIRRDEEIEKEMRDAARDFWFSYVVPKVEPPIDESESYGRYLARKYSLATGTVINNPSPELIDAATSLKCAEDSIKSAEAAKQFAKNTLASLLADADKAVTPMGKVGWVRPKPSQDTDWRSLAESLNPSPELIAQFTRPKQSSAYIRAWWSK